MLSAEQFIGFLIAAMVITASPGPDNLMVLGIGISKGPRRGIAFGLGCALGCLSHTFLAVVGVSALIASSPTAYTALQVGGGLYLVWLGVGALRRSPGTKAATVRTADESSPRLFWKGVFANAINPKVALFFLSFLPQFAVASRGNVASQVAMLGVIFTGQAAVLFGLLGYFAGTIGRWLSTRPTAAAIMDRLAGAVFVALGARLLTTLEIPQGRRAASALLAVAGADV